MAPGTFSPQLLPKMENSVTSKIFYFLAASSFTFFYERINKIVLILNA